MANLADIILPAGFRKVGIAIAPQIFDTAEARQRALMITAACDAADKQLDVATSLPPEKQQ